MTLVRTNQEIPLSDETLSDFEDGGHQPEDGNEYEKDLMLSRIKTKLLPLLEGGGAGDELLDDS
jgi:hypothetical protein